MKTVTGLHAYFGRRDKRGQGVNFTQNSAEEGGESEQGVISRFWYWYCTWLDEPRQDIRRSIKRAKAKIDFCLGHKNRDLKNSLALLFCSSKTSEPNLRHVRLSSSSN